MLYSINDTQICLSEAEPTLEFNRSMFITITMLFIQITTLSLKFLNRELVKS